MVVFHLIGEGPGTLDERGEVAVRPVACNLGKGAADEVDARLQAAVVQRVGQVAKAQRL